MKKMLLLPGCLYDFSFNHLLAARPAYIQTKDGVIVFTDPAFTGRSHALNPKGRPATFFRNNTKSI
jgi:hypothetical protein